jgi:hypothetical protein
MTRASDGDALEDQLGFTSQHQPAGVESLSHKGVSANKEYVSDA